MSGIIRDSISFFEALDEFISNRLGDVNISLPAKVQTYYEDEQSADILVLIKRKNNIDGTFDNNGLFVIPHVPVEFLGSADDVHLTFPIQAGTLGRFLILDRNVENWAFGNGDDIAEVADDRNHSLSDAIFIPGLRPKQRKYTGYNQDNIVLKNEGTTLSLKPDGKLKVENSTAELIDLIYQLVAALEVTTVATSIGAQKLSKSLDGTITTIKNELNTFKE